MDADCSLAASLLALDSEAAWELPELAELLSLLELLWEAELLSPESAWDELVLVLCWDSCHKYLPSSLNSLQW